MNEIEERIMDIALEEIVGGRTARRVKPSRRMALFPMAASFLVLAAVFGAVFAGPAGQGGPASPGERLLVFESGGTVWRIPEAGGDVVGYREIAFPPEPRSHEVADLSPDGKEWVYVSTRDGDAEIFRCDRDGGKDRKLTDNDDIDNMPRWSADGRAIVFASRRSGSWQIWIMDRDGGALRRFSDAPKGAMEPRVSPLGGRISFLELREARDMQQDLWDLVVTNLDGGGRRGIVEGLPIYDHAWSPDGRRLACGLFGKFVLLDVETKAELKAVPAAAVSPELKYCAVDRLLWKRDGSAIACTIRYVGQRGGGGGTFKPMEGDHQLFVLGLDGRAPTSRVLEIGREGRPLMWAK